MDAPWNAFRFGSRPTPSLRNRVHASEFRSGLDWIGTSSPVRLEDLRGRIVLLDFWTYG